MTYNASAGTLGTTAPEQFSDRTFQPDSSHIQNFDVYKLDWLGIAVNATSGATTFTMESWGNGQYAVKSPHCVNNVLYGFANYGIGNNGQPSLVTMSFSQDKQPAIQ
jgi:hypothetical protein